MCRRSRGRLGSSDFSAGTKRTGPDKPGRSSLRNESKAKRLGLMRASTRPPIMFLSRCCFFVRCSFPFEPSGEEGPPARPPCCDAKLAQRARALQQSAAAETHFLAALLRKCNQSPYRLSFSIFIIQFQLVIDFPVTTRTEHPIRRHTHRARCAGPALENFAQQCCKWATDTKSANQSGRVNRISPLLR